MFAAQHWGWENPQLLAHAPDLCYFHTPEPEWAIVNLLPLPSPLPGKNPPHGPVNPLPRPISATPPPILPASGSTLTYLHWPPLWLSGAVNGCLYCFYCTHHSQSTFTWLKISCVNIDQMQQTTVCTPCWCTIVTHASLIKTISGMLNHISIWHFKYSLL